MEGIPDRRGGRLFTDRSHVTVSAYSEESRLAQARRGPRGSDRDVRGTVASEVRGKKRRATKPEVARRSGSDVLNRQVPQSPPSGVQAQGEGARRKLRRGAGNERGASARNRKVVGSRSRSNASGSCSAYCRKAGRRRASQPVASCSIR